MIKEKAQAIGHRLKILRINKNIKQKDLAARLNVSQSYISDLESGKRMIPTATLFAIVEILDVPS